MNDSPAETNDIKPGRIYLDNNATTRPAPEVIEAIAHHLYHHYGNPGSRHAEGRHARHALETARETIADILGAQPKEVIFTSGGTEAINMAIFGSTEGRTGRIALTAGEHPATTEACKQLQQRGWQLDTLEVDSNGLLLAEQFESLPWEELKLVSVILAHNETGVVQDLTLLSEICRDRRVFLHVDAVQAVGKIPVLFHQLGATALSLAAHKFYGPRGIGALLLREGARIAPFQVGGHQEAGRRAGTELVALAVGMARALELFRDQQDQHAEHLTGLRDRLEQGLKQQAAPVVINGSEQHRLPNTLNISFPGIDGEAFLVAIDLDGIACSLGSTCASGSTEPAPALVAMGCPPEVYKSAVRFSVGLENTTKEIDEAIGRIAKVVSRLREKSKASTSP